MLPPDRSLAPMTTLIWCLAAAASQGVDFRTGNFHRAALESAPAGGEFRRTDRQAGPVGIAAQPGFREDQQLNALLRRFRYGFHRACGGCRQVVVHQVQSERPRPAAVCLCPGESGVDINHNAPGDPAVKDFIRQFAEGRTWVRPGRFRPVVRYRPSRQGQPRPASGVPV